MNIRKHYEDYSRDIQLVYNSQATIKIIKVKFYVFKLFQR